MLRMVKWSLFALAKSIAWMRLCTLVQGMVQCVLSTHGLRLTPLRLKLSTPGLSGLILVGEGADDGQGFEVREGAVQKGIVGFTEVGAHVGLGGGVGEVAAPEGVDDLLDEGVREGGLFGLDVVDEVGKALVTLALYLVPRFGGCGDAVESEHDAVGGVAELRYGGEEGAGGDEVERGVLEQVEGNILQGEDVDADGFGGDAGVWVGSGEDAKDGEGVFFGHGLLGFEDAGGVAAHAAHFGFDDFERGEGSVGGRVLGGMGWFGGG